LTLLQSHQHICLSKRQVFTELKHVEEAGIVPGLKDEFVIIGENDVDDSLVLSLRSIQYELAWERCRQLQAEDVVIKGKVGICTPKILLSFLGLLFSRILVCDPCPVFSSRQ
jgi:hypothetical protein